MGNIYNEHNNRLSNLLINSNRLDEFFRKVGFVYKSEGNSYIGNYPLEPTIEEELFISPGQNLPLVWGLRTCTKPATYLPNLLGFTRLFVGCSLAESVKFIEDFLEERESSPAGGVYGYDLARFAPNSRIFITEHMEDIKALKSIGEVGVALVDILIDKDIIMRLKRLNKQLVIAFDKTERSTERGRKLCKALSKQGVQCAYLRRNINCHTLADQIACKERLLIYPA